MALFGVANALQGPRRAVIAEFARQRRPGPGNLRLESGARHGIRCPHGLLLALAFFGGLLLGVPIGFVLAFASLVYFLSDPSLPILVYSQQVMAGSDHFVLLAIPFFVLAGLLMESNGMSSRLIELLLRVFGRLRGSMGLITISATAFFSGVSGSKLADVAAVGGIVMPAVRRTRQDPNEAAGLLACSAVMAETIPPCINMIIMGFVANISIAGLFMAGLVPAAVLALALAALAVIVGRKIDPNEAFSAAHADAATARRRARRAGDDRHDRQGRDFGRGHVHRGLVVRRGLSRWWSAGRHFASSRGPAWGGCSCARRRWRAAFSSSSAAASSVVVRADHRAGAADGLQHDDQLRPPATAVRCSCCCRC